RLPGEVEQVRLGRKIDRHPAARARAICCTSLAFDSLRETCGTPAQDQWHDVGTRARVHRPGLLARSSRETRCEREPAPDRAAQQRIERRLELAARVRPRQLLRASFAACLMLRASATRITSSAMLVA